MILNPNESLSDSSYFDCLENVLENSKELGGLSAALVHHARTNDLKKFGDSVATSQKALTSLIEASSQVNSEVAVLVACCLYLLLQAAYLVGVADPNSEAGVPGVVDQSQFTRANQAVQLACQDIVDPKNNAQVSQCIVFCQLSAFE